MKKIMVGILVLVLFYSTALAVELVRQKNAATYIFFPVVDADGDFVSSATGLDSEIDTWADGSAPDGFTDCTNEATEVGSNGWYYISLTASEMNADYIAIQTKTTSSGAKTQAILIRTVVGNPLNLATTTDGKEILTGSDGLPTVNVDEWDDTDVPAANVSGYPLIDLAYYEGETDVDGNIQSECTDALNAYDPPTRTELTTDKNSIITEVDANETKIDVIDGNVDNVVLYTDGDGSDGIDVDVTANTTLLTTIAGYTDGNGVGGIDADIATIAGYVDAEVAAIKTKTDQLSFTTLGVEAAVKELDEDSATIDLDGITVGTVTTATTTTDVTNQVTADVTSISGSSDAADNAELAFDGDTTSSTNPIIGLRMLYLNAGGLGNNTPALDIYGNYYGISSRGSIYGTRYLGTGGTSYGLYLNGQTDDMYCGGTGTIQGAIDATTDVTNPVGVIDTTQNRLVDRIWDELQSGHTTGSTFGKYLDSEISGIAGGTGLDSATTSRILHRIVWGHQQGSGTSSDSSSVTDRTVYKAYVAGAASVDYSAVAGSVWSNTVIPQASRTVTASCAGSGAYTAIFAVRDTSIPAGISGYRIDVEDSVGNGAVYHAYTNSSGLCTLSLDASTWTVYLTKTPYSITSPVYPIVSSDTTLTYYATAFDPGTPATANKCRIYVYPVSDILGGGVSGCKLMAEIPSKYMPVVCDTAPVLITRQSRVSDDSGYVYLDVYRSAELTAGDETSTVKYNIYLQDPAGHTRFVRLDVEVPDQANWEIDWTP